METGTIASEQVAAHPAGSAVEMPRWQRRLLLVLLGYEALGCLAGGAMLMADPSGDVMMMPVEIMNGAFTDFFIPGMILAALGFIGTASFWSVLKKHRFAWLTTAFALGGLNIWFWIEIAILGEIHWLHLMWGLPVVVATFLALPLIPSSGDLRRILLLSAGFVATFLYMIISAVVAAQWPGYDSVTMTVSELSAIGAPTRNLWMVLSMPYSVLMTVFGLGVLASSGGRWKIRVAGWLLTVYGVTGFLWLFAPMHLRETLAAGGGTRSDTMHLVLAGVTQVIYLVSLVLLATELGRNFRVYSVVTVCLLFVFGALTFLESGEIAVNGPTPFIGIWERANITLFMSWIVVLSAVLMKHKPVKSGHR